MDSFLQWQSWRSNINYVYPPEPMTGRLVTFLPKTQSRVIVAFASTARSNWWSFAVQPDSDGVLGTYQFGDFTVVVFDFSSKCHDVSPPQP